MKPFCITLLLAAGFVLLGDCMGGRHHPRMLAWAVPVLAIGIVAAGAGTIVRRLNERQ